MSAPTLRSRSRLYVPVAVIVGGLVWVVAMGLRTNLVYYKTPTEILQQGSSAYGERIRLGGLVEPGSVATTTSASDSASAGAGGAASVVTFTITDGTTRMTVVDTGDVPALFRPGAGVVVEGTYGRDGAFHADTILVKHSDRYSPPKPGQTPTSANLSDG